MILHQLTLQDFRNYSEQAVTLHPQVTHIVGDNAHGKTNVLEAIYLLGRGRSFRTSHRPDLIRHGSPTAYLRADAREEELTDQFAAELGQTGRRFLRNGKPARRPNETWPHIILFAPEETLLFKAGPSARRDYLDTLIEGITPSYRTICRNYGKVLQQRNRVLAQAWEQPRSAVRDQLAPWTDQLLQWGHQIITTRQDWVARLNQTLPSIHGQFAESDGMVALVYQPNVAPDAGAFTEALAARAEEEMARGVTLVGPHRDELVAELGGRDLRHFGSQGQHRSVVLTLKVAEVALARAQHRRTPILLLDDVASELDPRRAAAFFQALERMTCQIVLTTTHLEGIAALPQNGAVLTVHHGKIAEVGRA